MFVSVFTSKEVISKFSVVSVTFSLFSLPHTSAADSRITDAASCSSVNRWIEWTHDWSSSNNRSDDRADDSSNDGTIYRSYDTTNNRTPNNRPYNL